MSSVALLSAAAGQACDRCRLKKVKCDGATTCQNCSLAGVPCVVSAQLRRKTKVRGYQRTSHEELIRQLQAENDELKRSLAAERDTSTALRLRLEQTPVGFEPDGLGHMPRRTPSTSVSTSISTSVSTSVSTSATIIKHMGRMVPDTHGGERFSGSTSGVHFILSVQQSLQMHRIWVQPFPESCFCLHLLDSQTDAARQSSTLQEAKVILDPPRYFSQPVSFYLGQIDLFLKNWGAFCPILATTDLSRSLSALLLQRPVASPAQHPDGPFDALETMFQLAVILLVNSMERGGWEDNSSAYLELIHGAVVQFTAKCDMSSLQCLILYAFYLQLSNQPLLMIHLNGTLVRLAQSLGMHRHDRRFKFVAGQIEMRKRMWWWIYMFDKTVSIIHGLPRLIVDFDIDVDYPLDCDLSEVNATSLSFPLPGETTFVSGFTACVRLGRIMSDTLAELYTTTKRRNGADKICALHASLQAWRQQWSLSPDRDSSSSSSDSRAKMALWMTLMADITSLLIHRPALTFDDTIPQFAHSLQVCASTAASILRLLRTPLVRLSILGIAPVGPGLILQCGLMHVFYLVEMHSRQRVEDRKFLDTAELLDLSRELLTTYVPWSLASPSTNVLLPEHLATSLTETSNLLQSLHQEFQRIFIDAPRDQILQQQQRRSPTSMRPTDSPGSLRSPSNLSTLLQIASPAEQSDNLLSPPADFLAELGALDSLNQQTSFQWLFNDEATLDLN